MSGTSTVAEADVFPAGSDLCLKAVGTELFPGEFEFFSVVSEPVVLELITDWATFNDCVGHTVLDFDQGWCAHVFELMGMRGLKHPRASERVLLSSVGSLRTLEGFRPLAIGANSGLLVCESFYGLCERFQDSLQLRRECVRNHTVGLVVLVEERELVPDSVEALGHDFSVCCHNAHDSHPSRCVCLPSGRRAALTCPLTRSRHARDSKTGAEVNAHAAGKERVRAGAGRLAGERARDPNKHECARDDHFKVREDKPEKTCPPQRSRTPGRIVPEGYRAQSRNDRGEIADWSSGECEQHNEGDNPCCKCCDVGGLAVRGVCHGANLLKLKGKRKQEKAHSSMRLEERQTGRLVAEGRDGDRNRREPRACGFKADVRVSARCKLFDCVDGRFFCCDARPPVPPVVFGCAFPGGGVFWMPGSAYIDRFDPCPRELVASRLHRSRLLGHPITIANGTSQPRSVATTPHECDGPEASGFTDEIETRITDSRLMRNVRTGVQL